MFSTITPPFDAEVLYGIDRNAAFAMCYGAGIAMIQRQLDPDLHNPLSAELLVLHEEQRERREAIKSLTYHQRYSSGYSKFAEI